MITTILRDWLRAGLGVSIQIIAHSNHIGYWRENIITNNKTIITMDYFIKIGLTTFVTLIVTFVSLCVISDFVTNILLLLVR